MSVPVIRCSSKALLIRGDEILLNCCMHSDGTPYYDLPGGGQEPFEAMEEALIREVLEETGFTLQIDRFAAIAEEIYDDPALRTAYPQYCHRILHIFVAHAGEQRHAPVDRDFQMQGSRWFSIDEADTLPVLPAALRGRIREVISTGKTLYLGTQHHANS